MRGRKIYDINPLGLKIDYDPNTGLFIEGYGGADYVTLKRKFGRGTMFRLDSPGNIKEGKFFHYGRPAGTDELGNEIDETLIWAIDERGIFHIGFRDEGINSPIIQKYPIIKGKLKWRTATHTVLAEGKRVVGAGEVIFRGGVPGKIRARSGH